MRYHEKTLYLMPCPTPVLYLSLNFFLDTQIVLRDTCKIGNFHGFKIYFLSFE